LGAKFQPYNPIVSISVSTKEWYDLLHDDNDAGDVRDFGFKPILLLFSSYLTCRILSHKCCVCKLPFSCLTILPGLVCEVRHYNNKPCSQWLFCQFVMWPKKIFSHGYIPDMKGFFKKWILLYSWLPTRT
jgi:hypothetical protein